MSSRLRTCDFLSPSRCADTICTEITELTGKPNAEDVHALLRQLVRDVIEQCARTVEDYPSIKCVDPKVPHDDLCDVIAETLRERADDRQLKRTVAKLADAPDLGSGPVKGVGSTPSSPTIQEAYGTKIVSNSGTGL